MDAKKRKRETIAAPSSSSADSSQKSVADSAGPSNVSIKSEGSMYRPLNFSETSLPVKLKTTNPSSITNVSVKSESSMFEPVGFESQKSQSICATFKDITKDPVQLLCGHLSHNSDTALPYTCSECGKKAKGSFGHDHLLKAQKSLKKEMQKKYTLINEGLEDQLSSLKRIYTTLYMTFGDRDDLALVHEQRHLERHLKKQSSLDCSVSLNDIFKLSPSQQKAPRTVLTKGIAGIGKSFSVLKFILDWAEGEANQDVDFVFSLSFRELSLISGEKNLHQLLTEFHPALRHLEDAGDYVRARIIVILDGLDESRFKLDFANFKKVTSHSDVTSVSNLLVNLIQGHLLPDANLWITSRPAAASQIPAKHVDMVTEIRGFNDSQKGEYFKKRHELTIAKRIISHIQSSRCLDIMCQIPIFCWISGILFQEVFGADEKNEIPQTLTEMMAHFLFAQTKRRFRKYDAKVETNKAKLLKTHKEFLMKLGKLAFVQLQKNQLIFYKEDLEDCGIDIDEASVYSGFCNAVLREEGVLSNKKVFYFVHLTVQEFFAALYVYECLINQNTEDLGKFHQLKNDEHSLLDLLKMTVDKVLEKKNGHLDFFLRFLLGLTVEHNRRVLEGLVTPWPPNQDADKKIRTYLRSIRRKTLSPDCCISLFQAMVEMRDHKVKDEIQEYLKLSDRSKTELSPLHCSALAYVLQVSKNELDVLDLKSYNTTNEGRRRLIPAVRSSRTAILENCKVTGEWIEHLVFGLKFPFSPLRHLNLSNNDLEDSGVEILCNGLSSQTCRIEKLRLSGCMITEKGCGYFVPALQSNPSHLIELDLSYNHPGDTGKKLLSALKDDPKYKLDKLNFDGCGSQRLTMGFKKYACSLTLDPNTAHKNLLLSEGNRKVAWVGREQPYPRHADRFDHSLQALCEQGLTGRFYFEVQMVEPFSIGVAYKSIGRKGDDSKLENCDKSWCVTCSENGCYAQHGRESKCISSLCSRSSHMGVYLDWEAGTLSFYKIVSSTLTRLYTFNANFSEPLYPGVVLHPHSSALFYHYD